MAPWKYPCSRRNRCPQIVQRSFILTTPENTSPCRHWGQRWRRTARSRARVGSLIFTMVLERGGKHPHQAGGEIQGMALPGVDGAGPGLHHYSPAVPETDPRARHGVQGELAQVGSVG